MVFPSIRSFEEISMITFPKDKNSFKPSLSPSLKSSKLISNRRLKKLIKKNTRNFEYPIAS